MYVVNCYCYEDSKTPNLVLAYKTKKTAEIRKNKAIESNCYNRVEIVETDDFKFI